MADFEYVRMLVNNDAESWMRAAHIGRQRRHRLDLRGVEFPGADLNNRYVYYADLTGANLRDASLCKTVFANCKILDASLRGAHLEQAAFWRSDLTGTNFAEAKLHDVQFTACVFREGSLEGSRLFDVVFRESHLGRIDFNRAIVSGVIWSNVDLTEARHLDRMKHIGPSTVGLDTLLATRGQLPEEFLRGAGVHDEVIAYARSLANAKNPIQLYSCFISYSSEDNPFCERLRADLRAANVRCWSAGEDLKIGDPFRDEIEQAIRVHDKLLLVLSEHSVNSPWVQTEVESALARERRESKRILFPVRLDDAVLSTSQAWAYHVQLQRHIADFSDWQNYESYQRVFQRLLRDLRPQAGQ